jgi:hypothetical protein
MSKIHRTHGVIGRRVRPPIPAAPNDADLGWAPEKLTSTGRSTLNDKCHEYMDSLEFMVRGCALCLFCPRRRKRRRVW